MGEGTVWDDALADIEQKVACAAWIGHQLTIREGRDAGVFQKAAAVWVRLRINDLSDINNVRESALNQV